MLKNFKIDIKHNGNIVSDQTVDVSVSQKNLLEFEILIDAFKPLVTAYKWEIPGTDDDRVVNYDPEENTTTITKLTNDDLEKSSVKYHWITKSAAPRQIKGTVTIDGKEYFKTASFNVAAPSSSFSSNTGQVTVYDYGDGNGRLMFGNGSAGITFSSGIDGEGGKKLFQRVDTSDTRRQRDTGECECKAFEMYGDGELEKVLTYQDFPNELLRKKDLYSDNNIYSYFRYTRSDYFTTWLMFKHPDEGIWVPLREIHWWWSGDAQLNANTNIWELKNSGNSENPESQESSKLPEWNGNTEVKLNFKLIE